MNLADTVLTRATGERGTVATRLRAAFRAMDTGVFAERVSGELFELAAARPVRFDADEPDAGRGRVGRAVAVTDPVPEETDDLASGSLRQSWGLVSGLLDSGPGSLLRSALKKRWATWSVGRRRAMIAAGAAGLALVVLFAAVPGPRPSSAPPVTQNPEAEAPAAAQQDPDLDIGGDDPLVALEQLASRRDGCFRELSVLCLDGVDETGSGAWQIDRAALQAILAGGDAPRRLNVSSAQLVERLGDSALIDLGSNSDPASVLLLKGEAGWRIRDYLAPIGAEVAQGD
jgi:hypothetical protein